MAFVGVVAVKDATVGAPVSQVTVVASTFASGTPLATALAARRMPTVPALQDVRVTVYVEPEPVTPAEQPVAVPERVRSVASKPVTVRLKVSV